MIFAGEDLEYHDIPTGAIAFETYKLEVVIDNIRLAPEADHTLEAFWAAGGDGDISSSDEEDG